MLDTNGAGCLRCHVGPTRTMLRAIKSVTRFLVVLLALTVINAFVWEWVAGDLYDCTDGGIPGYFEPGYWVHGWDGHPVAVVPHVVNGRSMSEPDTLKAGWSVGCLMVLWCAFSGVSLFLSVLFARMRWIPFTRPNNSLHATAAAPGS